MDFLSIMTAIKHLPPFTEQEPEKVMERIREKEVIKRRLFSLCEDCGEIKSFIQENVTIFNGTPGRPKEL